MSYSFILPKVEIAIRDAIRAEAFSWIGDETQVQAGLSGGPLDLDPEAAPSSTPLPNVTCEASQAQVDVPHAGTFRVTCLIHVAHDADATNYADAMDQSGDVFDYVFDSDFLDALSVAGLTAYGITQTDQSKTRSGRRWMSSQSFELVCAGSTIS